MEMRDEGTLEPQREVYPRRPTEAEIELKIAEIRGFVEPIDLLTDLALGDAERWLSFDELSPDEGPLSDYVAQHVIDLCVDNPYGEGFRNPELARSLEAQILHHRDKLLEVSTNWEGVLIDVFSSRLRWSSSGETYFGPANGIGDGPKTMEEHLADLLSWKLKNLMEDIRWLASDTEEPSFEQNFQVFCLSDWTRKLLEENYGCEWGAMFFLEAGRCFCLDYGFEPY